MTTIDSQASSFPSHPSSSSPSDAFEATPSLMRPEWMPLDEVTQTWADFAPSASHTHALQAVGAAFLALSFEMSAHSHYQHAYHGLWRCSPAAVAQGIGEAIADLGEACQQWATAFLWLERFANEERHEEETREAIGDLFARMREQQQRLWCLLLRLGEEQRSMQGGKPLFAHLGHLSSSQASVIEKGG